MATYKEQYDNFLNVDTLSSGQINSINVDSKIADGSISRSKISNLSVDTLDVSTSGYAKSGKNSFNDTVNAGWYLDSNGVFIGNAGDTSSFKFTIGTGALTMKGGTITGGTIQTSTSGARVVITGNDVFFYDDTTGGGGSITGNVASALFPRTDGGNGTFVVQKRASTIADLGNVGELFFDAKPVGGERNYIFVGMKGGDANASAMNTHVIRMHAKETFQIGSDAIYNRTSGSSEIQINTPLSGGPVFNGGGSRVVIGGIDSNTSAPINMDDGSGGGGVVLGIQKDAGFDVSLVLDSSGGHFTNDFSPYYNNTYKLGTSSKVFSEIHGTTVYTPTIQYSGDITINPTAGWGVLPGTSSNDFGQTGHWWRGIFGTTLYVGSDSGYSYITYTSSKLQANTNFRTSGSIYLTGNMIFENDASITINGRSYYQTTGAFDSSKYYLRSA